MLVLPTGRGGLLDNRSSGIPIREEVRRYDLEEIVEDFVRTLDEQVE